MSENIMVITDHHARRSQMLSRSVRLADDHAAHPSVFTRPLQGVVTYPQALAMYVLATTHLALILLCPIDVRIDEHTHPSHLHDEA